jgi:mRNA interferase RelE/StbE
VSTSAGEGPYELVVPGPVSRAIREELPEAVAWAVIEFANGPLVDNPHRVGAELRGHLRGIHSAHLATFRIQYVIDDEQRTVTLRRVKARSDVYGLSWDGDADARPTTPSAGRARRSLCSIATQGAMMTAASPYLTADLARCGDVP